MAEDALRDHLASHGALSQLHQSGTCETDMREPYFASTRIIEIYSHWGQSEYYNPDHAHLGCGQGRRANRCLPLTC